MSSQSNDPSSNRQPVTPPSGSSNPPAFGRSPVVRCPQCEKRGQWFEAAFGPFCSERCQQIDLGKWFNEETRISSPLTPENLEELGDSLDSSSSQ